MRLRAVSRHFYRHSIRFKMLITFAVMAIGLVTVSLTTVLSTQDLLSEYHVIASRISLANRLVPITRDTIGTEAYYLVAGRETLKTTMLYEHITEVKQTVGALEQEDNTEKSRTQLRIISRTLGTLERYCGRLYNESSANASLERQNVTLEQIREVSGLVCEQINEYIYLELARTEDLDHDIQQRFRQILIRDAIAASLILLVMAVVQVIIDRSISGPIEKLVENTQRLSEGDFDARVESQNENEITVLNESFNHMVGKLQQLMARLQEDTRAREQLELRLMQEQINPHFLYNTLEIIVWLAESSAKEEVIRVVQSLSRFFRVVLSQGRAMITVREELDCIQSYLYIQHIRYMDIMTYEIESDDQAQDCMIQKLTLQPLIENALYHGIERKRGGGTIRVHVKRRRDVLNVTVSDTGCGMDNEQLALLRQSIKNKQPLGKGFGLSNIQKRVQLAYGAAYGLSVESAYGEGTQITLRIPVIPEEN